MRKHIKNNVSWVGKIDWELQEFSTVLITPLIMDLAKMPI